MKADQQKVTRLLKTARGQLDGIIKMVEENQYCVDIVNQIMASDAILHKTMKIILQEHLAGCVLEACQGSEAERSEKIEEMMALFDKLIK